MRLNPMAVSSMIEDRRPARHAAYVPMPPAEDGWPRRCENVWRTSVGIDYSQPPKVICSRVDATWEFSAIEHAQQ
jgi:hypothetical protein